MLRVTCGKLKHAINKLRRPQGFPPQDQHSAAPPGLQGPSQSGRVSCSGFTASTLLLDSTLSRHRLPPFTWTNFVLSTEPGKLLLVRQHPPTAASFQKSLLVVPDKVSSSFPALREQWACLSTPASSCHTATVPCFR